MKQKNIIFSLLLIVFMFGLKSCATIPKNATVVNSFDKDKYLGKWYEIARLDFTFERNLDNTTATYSLNDNGTIKVDNQGYNTVKNKWQQATGKAKFVGEDSTAMLKVSFFGPFYAGYNVIAIDDDYKYALVAGESLKYLWILSREKTIPDDVKTNYLAIAKKAGYDTSQLLWIKHDKQK
jgi:apolipoprotein D and lipocalin family protein